VSGKSSGYPLDRRLGGPQSQCGRCGEEDSLALTKIKLIHTLFSVHPNFIEIRRVVSVTKHADMQKV
jgi:ArsR family metal-binding transcriptional regulator